MQVPVRDMQGNTVESIEVKDALFSQPMNKAVLHQAVVRELANRRKGTHDTKTRSEVAGGGRKPWRQKHTGRARAGTIRSPLWRKGGIVFGPHPRSHAQRLPKKMRRLAYACLLSSKVTEGQLRVVSSLVVEQPKTKDLLKALEILEAGKATLIVLADKQPAIVKASGNLPNTKIVGLEQLSLTDLLDHNTLLMTIEAVRKAEARWAAPIDRKRVPVQA
ncbi:MAG: 50S ribosomal protein L4 [Chloroflexi bacterium]|nr:50S ribosomal protein L4 [Chloroflexota bacterium]